MPCLSPYTEEGAELLHAVLADPSSGPVAQFRVTVTGSGRHAVEQRTLCQKQRRVEASWFQIGSFPTAVYADAWAQHHAKQFAAQNPGWRSVVIGEPRVGRQPGRSYPALYCEPGRDEPARMTSEDYGIQSRAR